MTVITLNEEQTRTYQASVDNVAVQIPTGEIVGTLDPSDLAIVAECKRRFASTTKRIPYHRVQAHMAALQLEWDRTRGFDREYMSEFLKTLRTQDGDE